MSLNWLRVEMWGAAIENPPKTFIVSQSWGGGSWAASVDDHAPGRRARPLGIYPSKAQAQRACQDEANKWS